MSLLKQDTTRKKQVDKALLELEKDVEFEARGNKEYEVKAIINSVVYGQQANSNQMPSLYYLISWKDYPEEENTWESLSAVIHLWKLISTFYKEHPEKLTVTSLFLDTIPPMARPTVPKEQQPKQKRGCPSKGANKRGRK